MNKSEHRLGVSVANLVVRHIKVEQCEIVQIRATIDEINKLIGLDDISFDEKSNVLNLAYDASKVCIDGVEEILKRNGIAVSHDWWTKFKEGYYRFVDENVRDNSKHEPLSCHKPPPTSTKK